MRKVSILGPQRTFEGGWPAPLWRCAWVEVGDRGQKPGSLTEVQALIVHNPVRESIATLLQMAFHFFNDTVLDILEANCAIRTYGLSKLSQQVIRVHCRVGMNPKIPGQPGSLHAPSEVPERGSPTSSSPYRGASPRIAPSPKLCLNVSNVPSISTHTLLL